METKDPEKYKQYTHQRNKVRAMTKQTRRKRKSNFSSSVFIKDVPKLENKVVDSQLEDIKLSKKNIVNKLMELKIDKSPSPDAIDPRLLKETAEQLGIALESPYLGNF